ncbi:MAG: hypothetical protein ACKOXB_09435, partial [Flavobacteriales bacterium]
AIYPKIENSIVSRKACGCGMFGNYLTMQQPQALRLYGDILNRLNFVLRMGNLMVNQFLKFI